MRTHREADESAKFAERFPELVGTVNTHYPECYRGHPSCAWRVGYEDGLRAAAARLIGRKCYDEGHDDRWCHSCSLIEDLANEIDAIRTSDTETAPASEASHPSAASSPSANADA